ncbi:MAG: hypothetical protein RMJ52_12295 [Gemmataceae bacterium]|nr:hypothetical protein [Gemmataceae bacterium]
MGPPSEPPPSLPSPQPSVPVADWFVDPRSPLAWGFVRTGPVLAVCLCGLSFWTFNSFPLWITDTWSHVKYGQWIVEHGRLPEREPFCRFADPDQPLIDYWWLCQIGFYGVFTLGEWWSAGDPIRRTAGGVEMLLALQAGAMLGWVGCLLVAYIRRGGSVPWALTTVFAALVVRILILVRLRPQLLGECCCAALLIGLARTVPSRRALVVMPLIVALWANLHGSFGVGLLLLALLVIGRGIEVLWSATTLRPAALWQDRPWRRLGLTWLLAVLAVAVMHPYDGRLFEYVLRYGGHPNLADVIEWQPMPVDGFYLGVVILIALTQALSRQWLSPGEWLVLVVFGVLPLVHRRWLVWWVMLIPWVLLPHWVALGRRVAGGWWARPSRPTFRKTLLAALAGFAAVSWSPACRWLATGEPRPLERITAAATPWVLVWSLRPSEPNPWTLPALQRTLQEYYPHGFQGVVFTDDGLGDFLLWALPPEYPVMVYAHQHLFPPAYWREFMTVRSGAAGWDDILRRHQANLIVLEPERHRNLCRQLRRDPDWAIVFDGPAIPFKPQAGSELLIALRRQPAGTGAEP